MNQVVRLAIPSKGRLHERTLQLLRRANIDVTVVGRSLAGRTADARIQVLFVRPADIPDLVAEHGVHLGITGQDRIIESGLTLYELVPLHFGNCRLCVIVAQGNSVTDVSGLKSKRIATSYPHLVEKYFKQKKIPVHLIKMSGSLEAMVGLGAADAIVDIVETGSTLRDNGLRVLEEIDQFHVVLVGAEQDPDPQIARVVRMIENALVAEQYSVVDYNLPRDRLPEAEKITPGFTSPTVSPLEDSAWCAVKVMVKKVDVGRIMDELEAVGAVGILETQIQSCRL
jgi:ATP phosphoribosyltransferase